MLDELVTHEREYAENEGLRKEAQIPFTERELEIRVEHIEKRMRFHIAFHNLAGEAYGVKTTRGGLAKNSLPRVQIWVPST